MKGICCVLLVAVCAGAALCATIGDTTMEDDVWWGPPGKECTQDTSISCFRPEFRKEMIEDLRYRLKNHRPFRAPLTDDFSYGFNSDHMEEWIQYWAQEYPFKEREEFINKHTHCRVNVQGLSIHFVRVTPEVPEGVEVVPMLLLHGWPGSFLEFYDAIPHLTAVSDDRDFALELIIPSLPGFGYSDPAAIPGLGATEMGVVMRNLMKRLGYDRYYLQAGDWGEYVASTIATLYPDEVLGHHTNYARSLNSQTYIAQYLGSFYPDLVVDPALADRMYPISKILKFYMQEFGYYHIQAAKPDTIGIVLTDSPSGLLAYVLQVAAMATRAKYTYSKTLGMENQFTKAQLMDHLTLYWSTNTINTAVRIYAETTNMKTLNLGVHSMPSTALTWYIHAPDELIYQSPYLLKFKYPYLVNTTILNTGGHFLAMELPEIFSEDVLKAVTAFRRIHRENESTHSGLQSALLSYQNGGEKTCKPQGHYFKQSRREDEHAHGRRVAPSS